jgi:phosphatidate phosphatase APP1
VAKPRVVDWSGLLRRLGAELERQYDATKRDIAYLRRRRPACVTTYRGFATARYAWVRGRVLRDPGFSAASPQDRWWTNLRNTFRLLESDEIPYARLRVRFRGATADAVADEEGYFETVVEHGRPPTGEGSWEDAVVELMSPRDRDGRFITAHAPVLTPPPAARFGVISDMDDTVLHTETTRLIRMTLRVLFGNAHTRLPFPGVSAFYRALQAGGGGPTNPLFYVSSSPWNLYEVLQEFLRIQQIPAGPMFLRDWGFSGGDPKARGHRGHKLIAIRRIMATYPALRFILIGDTAQQDPEIYAEIVHDYPDRILALYIHDVSRSPLRTGAVQELAAEVEKAGSTLILTPDTLAAARHAASRGWIDPDALPEIEEDRREDVG